MLTGRDGGTGREREILLGRIAIDAGRELGGVGGREGVEGVEGCEETGLGVRL